MDMVKSLAHRKLYALDRFRRVSSCDELPVMVCELDKQEQVIGVYDNPPNAQISHLVVTTRAIILVGENAVKDKVYYKDIQAVEVGPGGKLSREISLRVLNRGIVTVECAGGEGRIRDSLKLLMFLRGVRRLCVGEDGSR